MRTTGIRPGGVRSLSLRSRWWHEHCWKLGVELYPDLQTLAAGAGTNEGCDGLVSHSAAVLADDPDERRQALEERCALGAGQRRDPAIVLRVECGCDRICRAAQPGARRTQPPEHHQLNSPGRPYGKSGTPAPELACRQAGSPGTVPHRARRRPLRVGMASQHLHGRGPRARGDRSRRDSAPAGVAPRGSVHQLGSYGDLHAAPSRPGRAPSAAIPGKWTLLLISMSLCPYHSPSSLPS